MVYIYLAYGMAFFSLGLTLAVYPKRSDAVFFSRGVPFLVAFGIVHGLNEWVDMARLLEGHIDWLVVVRSVLLPLSLFCLLLFGTRVQRQNSSQPKFWSWLPWVLLLVFVVIVTTSNHRADAIDSASRYLFGIWGALLAALVFFRERKALVNGRHRPGLLAAFVGFASYGFFAGIIARPAGAFPANMINSTMFYDWIGVPVEAFRGAAACCVTYGIIRLLEIYRWQHEAELDQHRERLEERVQDRTKELQTTLDELEVALAEIKTLSGLLPVCAWCRHIRDENDQWEPLERYVESRTEAEFTHGICPDCADQLLADRSKKGGTP